MNKRYVKSIDKEVSEVGFGSWQLAQNSTWGKMSEQDAIELVQEAYKRGVNMFDTAPGYGAGFSEKILGKALKDVRKDVVINTKVGHGPNGEYEFTIEGIRHSIQRSLQNLQTDYLDSVILHNPEKYVQQGNSPLIEELKKIKKEGLILGYGFSIDSLEELKTVLENNDVDTIEVMFNIIHQEPKYLFNEILKRGIFLIIKVPLDSGWLTGKYDKNSTFTGVRDRWTQDVKDIRHYIVKQIKEIVQEDPLTIEALRFILSFHQVSTVIPGTKNIQQLEQNIKASDYSMSPETKMKLEQLFEYEIKNLYTPW